MIVKKVVLRIDEFDNAAMADDRTGEVVRILRELADRVECAGIVEAISGKMDNTGLVLRDSNGNPVGFAHCDWEEGDEGEES